MCVVTHVFGKKKQHIVHTVYILYISKKIIDNINIAIVNGNECDVSCLTLSDPDYFRQLTIRGGGGALKAPRPPPPPPPHYDLENYCVNLHQSSYMCILPGVLGMFQLEFFKNLRF